MKSAASQFNLSLFQDVYIDVNHRIASAIIKYVLLKLRALRAKSSRSGLAVAWLWRGCGVVVAWLWRGCGVAVWRGCVAWLWRGVVVAWLWRGCGVVVAWLGGSSELAKLAGLRPARFASPRPGCGEYNWLKQN